MINKIFSLLVVITLIGCTMDSKYTICDEDIVNMYSSYVEQWKQEIKNAFDSAESEILKNPQPDTVEGLNEDPNKCICKGTGIIQQGDGHTTPCPFHSKSFQTKTEPKTIIRTMPNSTIKR